MIQRPVFKPHPLSFPGPRTRFASRVGIVRNAVEPDAPRSDPYPGGMKMGPFTGRDPDVKKPAWLRQRAPQGEKFMEVKESLSSLKLNTVCEEAQCPNIGEVPAFC